MLFLFNLGYFYTSTCCNAPTVLCSHPPQNTQDANAFEDALSIAPCTLQMTMHSTLSVSAPSLAVFKL
jgi:hypothetical protein